MDDIAIGLEALEHVFSDAGAEPINLSYGLLKSITDNFSYEIGRGGFGVVYMGSLGNGKVAVKKLSNPHALHDKQFLGEITCLKKAKHKNIVRFLGYCSETHGELFEFNGANVMAEVQKMLLCFEYVPNGNIRHYLQQEKPPYADDWPARYQMIRGICHGLHYLHDKQINHLDLKPENVMLDAQMEPKITDLGLSRFLDQGQSKMFTQHIVGTPRYIAPEIIDKGEISFKSDVYALGIIIIELLTGISMISIENWDESLDEDCPRMRRCTEIARNCTDPDKHNRPTVCEVISDLDKLESMITRSSVNQATPTAFPGTELVDVYPIELRFSFLPNEEMHCHLGMTNKTNGIVCFVIIPEVLGRKGDEFFDILPPMSTTAITLPRDAEEQLPSDSDKYEILVLITGWDDVDILRQKISMLSLDENAPKEYFLKAAHESLGLELHRAMLTSVVVVSEDDDRALVADTTCREKGALAYSCIISMDVHPTEPWVLILGSARITYIWNWQTNEKIGEYKTLDTKNAVARFIARKQWVVIGDTFGSIFVFTCPTMYHDRRFKAHHDGVTSLAVHPTRPFLLSTCSNPESLKLWDWSRNWSCTGIFSVTSPVRQVMFNPKHTNTFASFHQDRVAMMWRIGHPDPIAMTAEIGVCEYGQQYFTYIGDQHFIALATKDGTHIWDLQKQEHVHALGNTRTKDIIHNVVCHPTRPILVTASDEGTICVWDSITYRFKKAHVNLRCNPQCIGFTGSRRLVIGNKEGISVMDIDLE